MTLKEVIQRLERRRTFLNYRINNSNKNLTFDKAEAQALEKAIRIVEKHKYQKDKGFLNEKRN